VCACLVPIVHVRTPRLSCTLFTIHGAPLHPARHPTCTPRHHTCRGTLSMQNRHKMSTCARLMPVVHVRAPGPSLSRVHLCRTDTNRAPLCSSRAHCVRACTWTPSMQNRHEASTLCAYFMPIVHVWTPGPSSRIHHAHAHLRTEQAQNEHPVYSSCACCAHACTRTLNPRAPLHRTRMRLYTMCVLPSAQNRHEMSTSSTHLVHVVHTCASGPSLSHVHLYTMFT
jgi:hypothetical protein